MAIRNNPMHDTKTPPGQFRPPRYLRDEIKRIQEHIKDEEDWGGGEAVKTLQATYPSTDAEKRSEGLQRALAHERWLRERAEDFSKAVQEQRDEANAKLERLKQALLWDMSINSPHGGGYSSTCYRIAKHYLKILEENA